MLLNSLQFRQKTLEIFLCDRGHIGFDFETTGLDPYKGARAFIMGFTDTAGRKFSVRLDGDDLSPAIDAFFRNTKLKYCAHNAHFEMKFLAVQFGINIQGVVWDTLAMERLVKNNHLSYSLQKCAERMGMTKHQPMLEWLEKNKKAYHLAPLDIITPYVEQDAWLSWELARRQQEVFKHWDIATPVAIKPVVKLEALTTKSLFKMSQNGLLVDVKYCEDALAYEQAEIRNAKVDFERESGHELVESRKVLAPLFDARGIPYGRTEKGNASFTEDHIQGSASHPLVRALLRHRRAVKRASSYWSNFLELQVDGIIRPSINQNRAQTGRMSIQDPSAQNWSTDTDEPLYPIRRAFVARPGCVIASLDYTGMELRLICDEAEDFKMIDAIKSGRDFHQETADIAGVPRSLAKNGRFAKLYGAGVKRVALTLGVDMEIAQRVCDAIDESSPRVAAYSRELTRYAEKHKVGYNFLGRRFFFDKGHEYKFPNYRIQGAGGEILKRAILGVADLLSRCVPDNFMLIPVHDEIVLNISDLCLLPKIKEIMIAAYTPKHLPMDVSIHIGPNFHDLEEYKC